MKNKYLILTQGAPGSGKSTWCKNEGLENFSFNADKYRIEITGFKKDKDGNEVIDNSDNAKILSFINQELKERLKKGKLTVIDATQTNLDNLKGYYLLARKFGYTLAIKTFDLSLEELYTRNETRESYQKVQIHVIEKMYKNLQEIKKSGFFDLEYVIKFDELSELGITKKQLEKEDKIDFENMIQKYNVIYGFKDEKEIDSMFLKRYPTGRKYELFEEYQNAILINKLKRDDLINMKILDFGIVSFNFKKDAFFNRSWNEERIKSRGLFVNVNTNEVVARGYNKFFNLGEFEESSYDSIQKTYQGKIDIFKKENGFLGIVGYDSQSKNVLYCSKSEIGGIYSNIVEEHCKKFEKKMLPYLKKGKIFVFEIVDTKKDPHIIEYDNKSQGAYLLDIFENKFEEETMKYDELVKIGKKIGSFVKEKKETLNSIQEFTKEKLKELGNEKIEGFVLVDENGNRVKIKTRYYIFWKSIRKILRIVNSKYKIYCNSKKKRIDIEQNEDLKKSVFDILKRDQEIFKYKFDMKKESFQELYSDICNYIKDEKIGDKEKTNVLNFKKVNKKEYLE